MSVSAGVDIKMDNCCGPDDPAKLAAFQETIERGELVERDDWMPEGYRMGMLRMAEHHANSEIVGALPEGEWINRAPSLRRKLALIAKVQDEVGHGQMLYTVSEDLGKPRDAMLRDLITGRTKYHNVFNYPAPTWADIALIQWLVDGAAIMNQKTLADGSYGPYVRTMKRINMEEAFHFKSGEHMVLTLMSGTPRQKQMAQEAFDRWWWPCVMFFGPPDKVPDDKNIMMIWHIKTKSNDTLRRMFVDRFTPAARDLGLKIHVRRSLAESSATRRAAVLAEKKTSPPSQGGELGGLGFGMTADIPGDEVIEDPNAIYDATTGHWGFTEPDWDEFYRVIRGGGPCNKERVALRRFSYEQGAWVRRAIMG